ncbi:MAG: TetR/AcrR family transcriptional regulator [Nitratireductor sp.]|nr:TetR/AcrR family transcriptional regulator [Nitratireductor sp.]
MNQIVAPPEPRKSAREKLLDAALIVLRQKGYSATSVDDLCRAAGVTKGAFFHHFESKEALGAAAADHWSAVTGALFETAPYHQHSDPLQRLLAYIDFRRMLIAGEIAAFTCVAGTMVQETFDQHPAIRDACRASIFGHAEKLEPDIEAALAMRGITDISARSLALHTQVVLQGAFILAKADGGPEIAIESVDHLRRYIELLFASGDQSR